MKYFPKAHEHKFEEFRTVPSEEIQVAHADELVQVAQLEWQPSHNLLEFSKYLALQGQLPEIKARFKVASQERQFVEVELQL